MEQLHIPTSEILSFCNDYIDLSSVREYCINTYINQGEKEKAISLLEKSLLLDKEYPGLIYGYYRLLKTLHMGCNNHTEYYKYLWLLAANGNEEEYQELKKFIL